MTIDLSLMPSLHNTAVVCRNANEAASFFNAVETQMPHVNTHGWGLERAEYMIKYYNGCHRLALSISEYDDGIEWCYDRWYKDRGFKVIEFSDLLVDDIEIDDDFDTKLLFGI